jgi:putative transposase
MARRLPASMRTREELMSVIEGRLSTASAKDELVKLATRLIIEEGLEGEASDAIGRDYYEHGAQAGQGYRNGPRASEGTHAGSRGAGDRDAGARAFGP